MNLERNVKNVNSYFHVGFFLQKIPGIVTMNVFKYSEFSVENEGYNFIYRIF